MIRDCVVGLALGRSTDVYADHRELRRLLRAAFCAAGLGEKDASIPLADIIAPGASVLLKPNWVLEYNKSGATMDCMVTHPAFILAAVAEVVAAGAGRVLIADAPIQSARFDVLTPPWWRTQVRKIAKGAAVEVIDFRDTVTYYDGAELRSQRGLRDPSRFVEFDLAADSLLEAVSARKGSFRNTSYNPDDMAKVQRAGVHRFLLCKEPFEVDTILNLPKLKAHSKAGVTAALKNLVGINGDKNFLPHHRVGGSSHGGDCYEGFKPFKRMGEIFLDHANRRIGQRGYLLASRAAKALSAIHGGDLEGKWWGNDTTWRMVLDLNRLLVYGDSKGHLHETPQRTIYSLTDAIVAGDRNGPLSPEPVPLKAVTFSSNSAYADAAHLALMRFDISRVALVREAFSKMRYALTSGTHEELIVCCDENSYSADQVQEKYGVAFRAPDGWSGFVERRVGEFVRSSAVANGVQ